DHDEARNLKTRRRHDVEAGPALALEALGGGRAGHQIPCGSKHLASRRAEFEALVTEHNKNALRGRRQRSKFELQGHANSSPPSDMPPGPQYRAQPLDGRTDMNRLAAAAKPLVQRRHRDGKS